MLKARLFYENARNRGDSHMIILQKQQDYSAPLTFAVSGTRGKVLMAGMDYSSGGAYSSGGNWGYSQVATLVLEQPWEKHQKTLEALDFQW